MSRLSPLIVLLATGLCACRGPQPPEALVDLRTEYGELYGISTEAGILVLSELVEDRDELSFRYHVGNGMFDDVAKVHHRGDWLCILQPVSSQPNQCRLASSNPTAEEDLFLESRDEHRKHRLLSASLLREGDYGDFLVLNDDDESAAEAAVHLAGSGVYVYREGHLQLVGILNGLSLENPAALAFIGLDEIVRVLPEAASFVERRSLPRRADFEYGIPRDFAGERPAASGLGPMPEREEATPPSASRPEADSQELDDLLRDLDRDDKTDRDETPPPPDPLVPDASPDAGPPPGDS